VQPTSEQICVLVVDDEAPARKRLTGLLSQDSDVGGVMQAEDGVDAVTLIREAKPDLVFLDVQMPGVDGFGVIDAIGVKSMPLTVFVTAYDRFALQAFEADAVDYLLKPFGDDRYATTMERVKARLQEPKSQGRQSQIAGYIGPELLKLIEKRNKPGELWEWIVIKSRKIHRLLMTQDIDWIEAAGVYVTIHAKGEKIVHRGSLKEFATRLDPFRFVRIHRSRIVNLTSIAHMERTSHGDFEVVLKDGSQIMMTRTCRLGVEEMLGQSF
jgi:two-component system, LytTR family, response regulator